MRDTGVSSVPTATSIGHPHVYQSGKGLQSTPNTLLHGEYWDNFASHIPEGVLLTEPEKLFVRLSLVAQSDSIGRDTEANTLVHCHRNVELDMVREPTRKQDL
jgi:hypothetical protein